MSSGDLESISWGSSTQVQHTLGSDESLGGALLTPIPWLQSISGVKVKEESVASELEGEVRTESTETIDGPNGAGSIQTVSVSVNGVSSTTLAAVVGEKSDGGLRAEGGVTQGELLRQEQRAGVVPAAQLAHMHPNGDGEEDEAPHARGPEEIGMEDMGPQVHGPVNSLRHGMQGIDVEAAVGRKAEGYEDEEPEVRPPTPNGEGDEQNVANCKELKDDQDDDYVMVNAGGEEKVVDVKDDGKELMDTTE